MRERPCLAVTMGDPSGIGPLVTVDALGELPDLAKTHRVVVVGAPVELERAAGRLGRSTWNPVEIKLHGDGAVDLGPGSVGLLRPPNIPSLPVVPGMSNAAGGRTQLACIDSALELVGAGRADAIVTGPVSKLAITQAGVPFTGHTEHLARAAGVAPDEVTMLFAGPRLRVALVTTHLPLADVSAAVTVERLTATIERVVTALRRWWCIDAPRVGVLGMNPHAGEDGLFGSEESEVILPALEAARLLPTCAGAELSGPFPSEVGLRRTVAGDLDVAVAHYHDQATIACKLLEMGQSVNVTLGLPFLRTSVDHGVAYDAAVTGKADSGSMQEALKLAAELTARRVVCT